MYFKCAFLLVCLAAFTAATPIYYLADVDGYEAVEPTLVRHVRSPDGGSVDIGYTVDQAGRTASLQYNQNLYQSNDGRLTVDAYGYGSRNFDYNRNDYGGGLTGTYHFG